MLSIWKFFGRGGNGRNAIKSNSKKASCGRRKIDRSTRVPPRLPSTTSLFPLSSPSLSRNKREPASAELLLEGGGKWHTLMKVARVKRVRSTGSWTRSFYDRCPGQKKRTLWGRRRGKEGVYRSYLQRSVCKAARYTTRYAGYPYRGREVRELRLCGIFISNLCTPLWKLVKIGNLPFCHSTNWIIVSIIVEIYKNTNLSLCRRT